jgi:hypothetical protein
MKFKIGDHLQEIETTTWGIVTDIADIDVIWYLIKNDELGLINHWVPQNKLELQVSKNINNVRVISFSK